MSIKVKFFARMKDEAGLSNADVDYHDDISPREIWEQVTKGQEYPESVMLAINMEYVSGEPRLEDGDELAFFPPVTGG